MLSLYDSLYKDKTIPETFGHDIWIVKPRDLYGGKGIFLTKNLNNIDPEFYDYVVQKYLGKPLLLDGYKFDMRFHVLFTQDYKLYLHKSYFVRSTFRKYDIERIDDMSIHLTNLTYQKEIKDADLTKAKISHKEFIKRYKKKPYEKLNLMSKVSDIVIKTVDLFKDKIKESKRLQGKYYNLFGFDIILDSDLNSYLIEVNTNPGLSFSSPEMHKINKKIVSDTFALTVNKVFSKQSKIPKTGYTLLKSY